MWTKKSIFFGSKQVGDNIVKLKQLFLLTIWNDLPQEFIDITSELSMKSCAKFELFFMNIFSM